MEQLRLSPGDKVGLVACSNPLLEKDKELVTDLVKVLMSFGLVVEIADCVRKKTVQPLDRADQLMQMFEDRDVRAIFDVSGGDAANQVLPHLDFGIIRTQATPFFGYSDLSVLLNTIYHCAGIPTYHYQVKHIALSKTQQEHFYQTFFQGSHSLLSYKVEWLRGHHLSGEVIGGNIRCFLKLAGTRYLPDPKGKILFLESLGGGINRIASHLAQLQQMGYLTKCRGVIAGTFTQLEKEETKDTVEQLLLDTTASSKIPLVKTTNLGHAIEASCLVIGGEARVSKPSLTG